uniref:O-methyltransferase C-terminal domain-containing protein n=1 Tax=Trieres chinensis TaxID=1514140 RepID=A0A7S2E897_TRICV|mmetsp:Transcript_11979/g.24950  ORF Transcript_11979/g.24950 Transcript_11979/m.24950 type:complete len:433 (+) Transcript_11979:158-1456(+)|eukprot:CAMPEP_0183295000 /NCGR_PEP_ID=MMETSP0160_2-20130417/3108_1 /TAXON_ID=2839 ORGANISM="Odontella Sinensis, Strain Grunow 1884" /NCGR_SAMPLE_ID=MMETSP0160_2 /ASSEMBLY_ACC=CAM_ASM_000250 /LENGTH=432 /DNA_ID=CAMNT_0025456399 /DNA_START=122 /DNA_END=1423 /DNA_ORIENTATION=+
MVNPRLAFLAPTTLSWRELPKGANHHFIPKMTTESSIESSHPPSPVRHVPSLPTPSRPSSQKAVLPADQIGPAKERMFSLLHSHFVANCLYTVVNLGVPDVLGGETLTVRQIVDRIGNTDVNEDLLFRQLRLLSEETDGPRLFIESSSSNGGGDGDAEEFAYSLGPAGALLQTNVAGQASMACAVQHSFERPLWSAWSELPGATYGGSAIPPFTAANGSPVFEYYQAHPESMVPFQEFMATNSATAVDGMVEGYDWSQLEGKRVVDVGGGYGEVMSAVTEKYPDIEAYSLDLPGVIDMAPALPDGSNVNLVGGDMFDPSTIPPNCDVAFLRHILHDWTPDACGRILESLHGALPDHGQLLIVDAVMPGPGVTGPFSKVQKQVDMLMAMFGGQERTLGQWTELLENHGWEIDSVVENTPSLNLDGIITCSKGK